MKIGVHSDLHLEQGIREYMSMRHPVDVLVLAGDIVTAKCVEMLAVARLRQPNAVIIYVMGNHDFYGLSYTRAIKRARDVCNKLGIHLLHRSTLDVGNIRFIGCTGWATLNAYPVYPTATNKQHVDAHFADTYAIEGWNANRMIGNGEHDKRFIIKAIKGANQAKKIPFVVTHFPPATFLNSEKFDINPSSPYFVNDWVNWDERLIPKYWAYGHTHYNRDPVVYGKPFTNDSQCTFICNQKGYVNEMTGYKPNFIFTI